MQYRVKCEWGACSVHCKVLLNNFYHQITRRWYRFPSSHVKSQTIHAICGIIPNLFHWLAKMNNYKHCEFVPCHFINLCKVVFFFPKTRAFHFLRWRSLVTSNSSFNWGKTLNVIYFFLYSVWLLLKLIQMNSCGVMYITTYRKQANPKQDAAKIFRRSCFQARTLP